MTLDDLTEALCLPEATRVNQRVPKKLLADQEVATPADRRAIQDGVDEVFWLAALKPHLIGVPAYEDAHREYLELAVLRLSLKPGTKPGRLVELLHRAVPYPVLLLTSSDAGIGISLVHLRRSQNEADKTVLDGGLVAVTLPADTVPSVVLMDFYAAFALERQPQADLHALYQGWMDLLTALDAAAFTGRFECVSPQQATVRRLSLDRCRELDAKISSLRAAANKEMQIGRQVEINSEIKALMAQRQQAASSL